MSYRPLAVAAVVTTLSVMHIASASAQSVYVAPGGIYIGAGAGPVYLTPGAPINGAAAYVDPGYGYDYGYAAAAYVEPCASNSRAADARDVRCRWVCKSPDPLPRLLPIGTGCHWVRNIMSRHPNEPAPTVNADAPACIRFFPMF
jgi:hypothetical protein